MTASTSDQPEWRTEPDRHAVCRRLRDGQQRSLPIQPVGNTYLTICDMGRATSALGLAAGPATLPLGQTGTAGAITNASIGAAGTGYTVNDVVSITGGTGGAVVVLAVNGSGRFS